MCVVLLVEEKLYTCRRLTWDSRSRERLSQVGSDAGTNHRNPVQPDPKRTALFRGPEHGRYSQRRRHPYLPGRGWRKGRLCCRCLRPRRPAGGSVAATVGGAAAAAIVRRRRR